jgi:UDP-N-acetylmuramoyl-tripeptide--D-alanyl-D-alanine ligase
MSAPLGTAPLWTGDEAAAATRGQPSGRDWIATGVSIDSRTVQPGDLFVALAGPNHDGHAHVAAALKAGAAAALVHRPVDDVEADAPLLTVADTLQGLRDLGAASRARMAGKVIAVTGSVGKTGTKEMLKLALECQGNTHASIGSFNNHWGVPLSLARMPRDTDFGVFEIGMNHSGEIADLVPLVRPHVAIVTTVEAVHLEFFGTVDAIADAKAEIFLGLEPGGIAVLNRDNRHFSRLRAAALAHGVTDIRGFGSHIDADARLLDCACDPSESCVFALFGDQALAYKLGVPGRQWAMNSLGVLLGVKAAGADLESAARALSAMVPPKGRGARHVVRHAGGNFQLIDESYNASPVSMRAAIASLAQARPAKGARRIAVLGDMRELGPQADALHAELAEILASQRIDMVFTAGMHMAALRDSLPTIMQAGHAATSTELAPQITAAIRPGDVVVVKGSAGSRMNVVVQALLELGQKAAGSAVPVGDAAGTAAVES